MKKSSEMEMKGQLVCVVQPVCSPKIGLCVGAFLHDSESNLCQMTSYKMCGAVGVFFFWFSVGKLHVETALMWGQI